jgi:hypothetical protein
MTACKDCGTECIRRTRCKNCGLFVCRWCFHHSHNVCYIPPIPAEPGTKDGRMTSRKEGQP